MVIAVGVLSFPRDRLQSFLQHPAAERRRLRRVAAGGRRASTVASSSPATAPSSPANDRWTTPGDGHEVMTGRNCVWYAATDVSRAPRPAAGVARLSTAGIARRTLTASQSNAWSAQSLRNRRPRYCPIGCEHDGAGGQRMAPHVTRLRVCTGDRMQAGTFRPVPGTRPGRDWPWPETIWRPLADEARDLLGSTPCAERPRDWPAPCQPAVGPLATARAVSCAAMS